MSLSPHVLPLKKLYLDLEDHSVIIFSHPHEFLHTIILFYAITHAFKFNYLFFKGAIPASKCRSVLIFTQKTITQIFCK